MSVSHRTMLASAAAIGLLALSPSALAQEDGAEPEAGDEAIEDVAIDDVEDADEGDEADAPSEPSPPPDPPPSTGGWGVGGEEEEGRFAPSGKTGKLKELEEEEARRDAPMGPAELGPPGWAYLDTAIGFGDARVVVGKSGTTDVTPTASFLIAGGYRFGDTWHVGARFPVSTGYSNGPSDPYGFGRDPDEFRQIAVGNVELGVKPAFVVTRHLRLPFGVALTIPSAMGDLHADANNRADLGKAIVNQAAASSRGFEDRALFEHDRFGITPSAGVWFRDGAIEASAETKVEIMIRTGGNDAQPVAATESARESRDASYNWVTALGFFYGFFDGYLAPGTRLWLAVGGMSHASNAEDYSGAQFVFEPNVKTTVPFTDDKSIGMNARVGYMVPMGGHLGGENDASMGGLRVTTGLFF